MSPQQRHFRRAFTHLWALLKPRAALFVVGMDIDLRQVLSKKAGLRPLGCLISEIHDDAMTLRGAPWPWNYWGLEPLNTAPKDWKQRYALSTCATSPRPPSRRQLLRPVLGQERLLADQA